MTNTKLTDRKIAVILARAEICDDSVLTDYADIVAAMRELQERRKAGEWIPVSTPPNDHRMVYCWSGKSEVGVEARYRNGEWIVCHDDEEDEEENFTHWIELPKGPAL